MGQENNHESFKTIYLARHGESVLNTSRIHQRPGTELSELGLKQADALAAHFSDINLDIIISSPFTRAKQTAERVAQKVEKPLIISDLFAELKRPSVIEGKNTHDPDIKAIKALIAANYHNPEWRYADEENFFDLKARGLRALTYLEQSSENKVLVLSHGIFINMLVSLATFTTTLSPEEFTNMLRSLPMANTGINTLEFDKGQWKIVELNNDSHLNNVSGRY